MIPFQPNRCWYERYWWDEGPSHGPLVWALIAAAGQGILRMFRPPPTGANAGSRSR